ncbi:sulfatase-like hydrolase/transferase [Thalassoglobus sp. JC818]|uniref:sulfatase-like hydrolase/transferase n=1 Tax=Thalassoglobus sp. JC818 TaxID=3232136 RepID=UPI00345B3860
MQRCSVGASERRSVQEINVTSPSAISMLVCTIVLVFQFGFASCLPAESTATPNVILIMADDMGFECVGANGGASYQTPTLDQLAASGMRFENCFSQPICTPSRVQIMSGIYNSRNYVEFGLLDPSIYTFGNLLQDSGYRTCVVGKWQLGGGFEGPNHFGFDEYCLWQVTRRPNRYPNPGLEINHEEKDFKEGQYGPDIVSDYACDFIRRQVAEDQKFFVYYPMILPHWPFEPTPDSEEWDPKARVDDVSETGAPKKSQKFFGDMVTYADKMVGKIVATLDELDVRDETLILFTGDNGTYESIVSELRGKDWRGGKSYMTDHGTHVPLIVNWPGRVEAGTVNTDLIDFSDFLPTLADATSAAVPENLMLDGQSFWPQLQGEVGNPRSWVYCWYFRNGVPADGGKKHSAGETARTHEYKLYRTGNFYSTIEDDEEQSPLSMKSLSAEQKSIRQKLEKVIEFNTREGYYEAADKPKGKKASEE